MPELGFNLQDPSLLDRSLRERLKHPYKGDVGEKAESRTAMYRALRETVFAKPGTGAAVVLAGPDLGDLPLLTNVLRWDPRKIVVVDIDNSDGRLDKARRRYPGVTTFCGDLTYALKHLGEVGFACLDLMGPFSWEAVRTFEAVGERIAKRGAVSYTFLRGREQDITVEADVVRHSKRFRSAYADPRMSGVSGVLAACLEEKTSLVYEDAYQSDSPMGVVVVATDSRRYKTRLR